MAPECEQGQPADGDHGEAERESGHADLSRAHRSIAQDEAAAAQGRQEAGDEPIARQTPTRAGSIFRSANDGGSDQRHRRAANGREGR